MTYTHLPLETRVDLVRGMVAAREEELFKLLIEIDANEALEKAIQPPRKDETRKALGLLRIQKGNLTIALTVLRDTLLALQEELESQEAGITRIRDSA